MVPASFLIPTHPQEQAAFGKCDSGFMIGYCKESCGRCACDISPPPPPTPEAPPIAEDALLEPTVAENAAGSKNIIDTAAVGLADVLRDAALDGDDLQAPPASATSEEVEDVEVVAAEEEVCDCVAGGKLDRLAIEHTHVRTSIIHTCEHTYSHTRTCHHRLCVPQALRSSCPVDSQRVPSCLFCLQWLERQRHNVLSSLLG
jgi:hypothetical protein